MVLFETFSVAVISIHAPHAGSDCPYLQILDCYSYFNPRSPCGERRRLTRHHPQTIGISIHAPHAGSDLM